MGLYTFHFIASFMQKLNNKKSFSAAFCESCKENMVVKQQAHIISKPVHSLHLAVRKEDVHLVKKIIRSGADVNSHDSTGHTPMHYAAHSGNIEIIRTLLHAGAKEDLKCSAGETAFCRAKSVGKEVDYKFARYEAEQMKKGDGYYGWLAEKSALEVKHEKIGHLMYHDGLGDDTPSVRWEGNDQVI